MLYLALAVACSLAIGMIFKYTGRRRMDRTALLTANYAAAVCVAGLLLAWGRDVEGGLAADTALLTLGVGTGVLLIFGFFMLSLATEVAGMSLAIGVMRVSVVIPFGASWVIWGEEPSVAQVVGLVLAGGAFFMIAQKKKARPDAVPGPVPATASAAASSPHSLAESPAPPGRAKESPAGSETEVSLRAFGVLALLFLAGGAVDVSMKTFEETFGAHNNRVLFLLLGFGVAFLIGLAIVLWTGWRRSRWPDRATVGWGVLLGVINYGSLEFILRAINTLPGTFVFPVNSIAIVLLGAVVGVYVWNEHLTRTNCLGLGLAVMALLLLNL